MQSQGDLVRPYADFPSGEDTPYPPSPSSSPEPLWSPSREGTDILIGLAHPVLSQKPGKAGPEGCCVLRSQAGSHTDQSPGPIPLLAGGCLLSFPSTWPQMGASVAAALGLRREKTGPNPRLSLPGPCQRSREKWEGCAQELRSHLKGTGAEA